MCIYVYESRVYTYILYIVYIYPSMLFDFIAAFSDIYHEMIRTNDCFFLCQKTCVYAKTRALISFEN